MNTTSENQQIGISQQQHMEKGGTIKRLAAKASLQRPYEDQTMTPFQLYQWATSSIPSISFTFCITEEYQAERAFLEKEFSQ